MRSVILFFVINIIVVIDFFEALSMKTPWFGFAMAFGVWLIYLLKVSNSRSLKSIVINVKYHYDYMRLSHNQLISLKVISKLKI